MAFDPVSSLEREWRVLEGRGLATALPGWRAAQLALRPYGNVRQLIRLLNSAPPEQTDGPLLALLTLARHDRRAGRVVLQAILPALKSQAERISYEPGRREEVWELLLFFAWNAICCYPIERRRLRVAANLVLQVLHDTTRELRRPNLDPTVSNSRRRTLASSLPGVQPTTAEQIGAEALLMSSVAAGLIAARDAELVLATRVDGVSLRLLARVRGVGYDALRKRRQRAEKRLRLTLSARRHVPTAAVLDLISDASSPSKPSTEQQLSTGGDCTRRTAA